MDLFADAVPANQPLAARMRPRNLEEYVGQDHIVGVGRLLRRAIDADQLSSLIFYGPPGTGKTTLARVIAGSTQSRFVTLNAVLTGVADIRREISDAKDARDLHSKRTILFVDEVHRWNKSQQDALLPWVENGTVILIGATTENPYFEVNKALVSRSRVFQLTALQDEHLAQVARLALADQERGYGNWTVEFEEGALEHLVKVSSGDARSLLNALQLAVETSPERFPPPKGSRITVSLAAAEESIQKKAVLYDKEGDYHFDTISAFIKSLRGSDPDAALYWMALMIRAGEDPRFIFRRMLISACEDVGLAAPEALGVVESCAAAFDRVGLPEGQFHLTHAALYLATCPKSNSALGFFDALKAVDEERNKDVPNHLRDDSRDKHSFGHGEGYKYPHAWRDHWTAQQYLPDGLAGRVFYRPGHLGHEGVVRDTVISRREAQVAAMLETDESQPGEVLTYSPGDDERERWVRRTESRQETLALAIRHALYQHWSPQRHHRILILADPAGALVWEAHRRVPEGGVTALCPNTKAYDALSWLAGGLPVSERPRFQRGVLPDSSLVKELTEQDQRYDHIIARNWLANMGDENTKNQALHTLRHLAAEEAVILLAEPRPEAGTTLSQLIPAHLIAAPHFKKFQAAERIVHASLTPQKGQDQIIQQFSEAGWNVVMEPMSAKEQRILSPPLLEAWFSTDRVGSYGQRMSQELGQDLWKELSKTLLSFLTCQKVTWETAFWRINGVRTS